MKIFEDNVLKSCGGIPPPPPPPRVSTEKRQYFAIISRNIYFYPQIWYHWKASEKLDKLVYDC